MSEDAAPALPTTRPAYVSNEIILYGTKLNNRGNPREHLAWIDLSPIEPEVDKPPYLQLGLFEGSEPAERASVAAIIAYSFEGHCYRLDKPRIFLFSRINAEPAHGCSFDQMSATAFDKPESGYFMWRVRTKTPLLELAASIDLAETLILEANLPGRRSPNTYHSESKLAHRGGRLTTT